MLDRFVGSSQKPMSFDARRGQKSISETVSLWSESLQRFPNVCMLKCPLVYSIGQLVMNQGYGFVWEPGELPFLDHYVPVFQEQVEISSGLPVVPICSEDAKEPQKTFVWPLSTWDGKTSRTVRKSWWNVVARTSGLRKNPA